jgi:hypothetical protein
MQAFVICQSKHPLLPLLLVDTVFPKPESLVGGVGGQNASYIAIIQGENGGPHQEGALDASWYGRGWYWIPQAPQMPYANNLDLVVFPCIFMSKRHTQLL